MLRKPIASTDQQQLGGRSGDDDDAPQVWPENLLAQTIKKVPPKNPRRPPSIPTRQAMPDRGRQLLVVLHGDLRLPDDLGAEVLPEILGDAALE